MEFLPWKTVDLDGAFRVTAPESIAEEVIQEVSNAITFRFRGDLSEVRLEILLTPPWGWEDCFPADEQDSPPAGFFCRLISRSTGRRLLVPLEPDGFGLWFAEISYNALLDGEEIRAEALLVRTGAATEPQAGLAGRKGQIIGRSGIHVVRFSSRTTTEEAIFQLRWESFHSGRSQQLWRLQPGEPPTLELNTDVAAPLRRLLMSRSRRRSGGAVPPLGRRCGRRAPQVRRDALRHGAGAPRPAGGHCGRGRGFRKNTEPKNGTKHGATFPVKIALLSLLGTICWGPELVPLLGAIFGPEMVPDSVSRSLLFWVQVLAPRWKT